MSTETVAQKADNKTLDGLLAAIGRGSMDALEQLYRLTATPVHSFALSILKNRHDAEDVLHDCFLNIYRAASGYRSGGKPMAWILTITKNLCLSKLRDGSRHASLDDENAGIPELAAEGLDLEEKLLLEACLSQLSAEEQQIITLHLTAGFKHREIASMLDMPLSTVLSKYNRSMKKLRSIIS